MYPNCWVFASFYVGFIVEPFEVVAQPTNQATQEVQNMQICNPQDAYLVQMVQIRRAQCYIIWFKWFKYTGPNVIINFQTLKRKIEYAFYPVFSLIWTFWGCSIGVITSINGLNMHPLSAYLKPELELNNAIFLIKKKSDLKM